MPRFFNEAVLSDDQLEEPNTYADGDASPEALYNDYRNRMPFHYIEDDINDGYYYWTFGATISLNLELEGELAATTSTEDVYISIVDFLKDSPTKYLKFEMQDFRGEVIDTQIIRATDLTYQDKKVYAHYDISQKLSAMMVPEQYKLFIYLIDEAQDDTEEVQTYNKCLTENGILIRVK